MIPMSEMPSRSSWSSDGPAAVAQSDQDQAAAIDRIRDCRSFLLVTVRHNGTTGVLHGVWAEDVPAMCSSLRAKFPPVSLDHE